MKGGQASAEAAVIAAAYIPEVVRSPATLLGPAQGWPESRTNIHC